jgi:hypothetical protein
MNNEWRTLYTDSLADTHGCSVSISPSTKTRTVYSPSRFSNFPVRAVPGLQSDTIALLNQNGDGAVCVNGQVYVVKGRKVVFGATDKNRSRG